MANDILTVADCIADAHDIADIEVSDLLNRSPFLRMLPVTDSSNGEVHKYTKETGAPVVGFRAENTGREYDHSVDTLVTVNLKILDYSWLVDKAVADRWRKGGHRALIAREGRRHMRAAFYKAESQFLNGTVTANGGDSAGFAGFANAAGLDAIADEMVVNAGGTTADTAASCYMVRLGEDAVSAVMIQDSPMELGETTVVQHDPAGDQNYHPAYYTPASTWLSIQIGGARDICRIANLTEDSGKGLTDDLIFDGFSKFAAGSVPSVIVTNRRGLKQLRQSRTATNATGAPAPIPTEVAGVPILVTDALSNTEALLT